MKRNLAQADNAIVLCFRNLQLKRIGALQDELIELSMREEQTNWKDEGLPSGGRQLEINRVDEVLRAYGEESSIQRSP